jgi:hypothetical protein
MTRRRPMVDDRGSSEARTGVAGKRSAWKANPEVKTGGYLFFGRAAIGILAAVAIVACGAGARSAATNSGRATPAPATSAAAPVSTPPALPPTGGPAPSQLIGNWYQVASSTIVLTLTATGYVLRDTAEQGSGDIVVHANEIDFFSGTLCSLVLPQGVGRYHWTLQGAQLHLAPLNTDPCGRIALLTNQSYTKPVS